MNDLKISRRGFISRAAILTGGLTAGLRIAGAETPEPANVGHCRFVFATDSHLMVNNKLRSEDGLVAALSAIEYVTPKPVSFYSAEILLMSRLRSIIRRPSS